MSALDILSLHLGGCIEDAVEKLHIAGQVMPITYEMKQNAKTLVEESVTDIIDTQRDLELRFSELLNSKNDGSSNPQKDSIETLTKSLKAATHGIDRLYHQNPLGSDNLEKIESDRLFLEMILQSMLVELDNNDFRNLKATLNLEKENKQEYQSIIKREKQSRNSIKELQKALVDIKQDKEVEMQQRNELIAHLKDRLQELKAKTQMEAKYVKKSTDNSVAQVKKKCDLSEVELRQQIEKLQEQIDDENRCTAELESFLNGAIEKMKTLTDYWSEKCDRETIQKQVDLDRMKNIRQKDLEKYQNLLRTFNEYEKIVIEDRNDKERAKRQAEQEQYELESTVKIQAWWRGMMMRHKLGAYGKKKKGKGKKSKNKK